MKGRVAGRFGVWNAMGEVWSAMFELKEESVWGGCGSRRPFIATVTGPRRGPGMAGWAETAAKFCLTKGEKDEIIEFMNRQKNGLKTEGQTSDIVRKLGLRVMAESKPVFMKQARLLLLEARLGFMEPDWLKLRVVCKRAAASRAIAGAGHDGHYHPPEARCSGRGCGHGRLHGLHDQPVAHGVCPCPSGFGGPRPETNSGPRHVLEVRDREDQPAGQS